jgi:hypothetical protein
MKKEITNVIDAVYRHCGQKETVISPTGSWAWAFLRLQAGIPSARTT